MGVVVDQWIWYCRNCVLSLNAAIASIAQIIWLLFNLIHFLIRTTGEIANSNRDRLPISIGKMLLHFNQTLALSLPTRFCRRHRLKTGENVPSVPRELLLMSEMVLPRFIISVIQYLREGYTEPGEGTGDYNAIKVCSLLRWNIQEQIFLSSLFYYLLELCQSTSSSSSMFISVSCTLLHIL